MRRTGKSGIPVVAGLALALGACSLAADRSIADIMLLEKPEPPRAPVIPTTTGELKDQVERDGYPDASYFPNPERIPVLSEDERAAVEEELTEIGRRRLEDRVMTCGADDPAKCVR